jgi:hypothetical protein
MRHAQSSAEEANSVRRTKEVYVDKVYSSIVIIVIIFSLVNTYYSLSLVLSLLAHTSPLSEPMKMREKMKNKKGETFKKSETWLTN